MHSFNLALAVEVKFMENLPEREKHTDVGQRNCCVVSVVVVLFVACG